MEYVEEDYLMISGIQHFKFCRRQWALIHVEQQWAENAHTVVGELMHRKVHDPYLTEKRKPANKKSSVFLKKISKIRFDILCITFKPPEMPALKVVI